MRCFLGLRVLRELDWVLLGDGKVVKMGCWRRMERRCNYLCRVAFFLLLSACVYRAVWSFVSLVLQFWHRLASIFGITICVDRDLCNVNASGLSAMMPIS